MFVFLCFSIPNSAASCFNSTEVLRFTKLTDMGFFKKEEQGYMSAHDLDQLGPNKVAPQCCHDCRYIFYI